MQLKVLLSELTYFLKDVNALLKRLKTVWYMAASSPRVWSINGTLMRINHPAISNKIKKAILKGVYEFGENSTIRKFITKDDILMEVGSGMGFNSITAARLIGSERVHTFEANPGLIPLIKENAALNNVMPNVYNKILVNDGRREIEFNVSGEFWESSMVHKPENSTIVKVETANFTETLNAIKPTFMVVDIEGAEIELLTINLPESIKKLCLDTHPFFTEIGDNKTSELVHFILQQGFVLKLTAQHGFVLYFER
jgi:FkbM family methyltransferase